MSLNRSRFRILRVEIFLKGQLNGRAAIEIELPGVGSDLGMWSRETSEMVNSF